MEPRGAYTADRAAALSGVPRSTIHWWARNDILVPSVSATKVKLWSHSDLMGLRVIYWLRQRKTSDSGAEIPSTSMRTIRRALGQLGKLSLPLWTDARPSVLVDGSGRVHLASGTRIETVEGQLVHPDVIDLVAPFSTREGSNGPDLVCPRPTVRIAPGKLGGSPHVEHTRVETRALAALGADGLAPAAIAKLYPYLTLPQITEALDLEAQLVRNLAA